MTNETKTVFFILCLGVIAFWRLLVRQRATAIATHKKNLLKGGLIPRVDGAIHKAALTQLGREKPNFKLPHAQYFDN
jgi:hypothetical protein